MVKSSEFERNRHHVGPVHELAARVSESEAQARAPSLETAPDAGNPVVKSRGRRVLTAQEVDRMPFNPQEGWEEQVGLK